MKNEIIVKIAAGLGNQMFMYSNAFALSKKSESFLSIDDKSGFFQKKNRSLSREYNLNFFKLSSKITSKKNKYDNYLKHFFKKILIIFDFFLLKKKFYKEKIFKNKNSKYYCIDISRFSKKVYIEGYFQSEKYFIHQRKKLIKEFSIDQKFVNSANNYKKLITDNNSVSLHIRRNRFPSSDGKYGDPKYSGKIVFDQVIDYTLRGVEFFEKNIDKPKFFIWSDNFDNLNKYFDKKKFIFVKNDKLIDDFYLFQFTKHFVVSPSTFHWWGAWLNNNSKKICLRPKNINPSNNLDFWPESWIKI